MLILSACMIWLITTVLWLMFAGLCVIAIVEAHRPFVITLVIAAVSTATCIVIDLLVFWFCSGAARFEASIVVRVFMFGTLPLVSFVWEARTRAKYNEQERSTLFAVAIAIGLGASAAPLSLFVVAEPFAQWFDINWLH